MALKIIDEKPDPSVVETVVCSNCGVKIEYVPNDVRSLWRGTDYGGGPDGGDGFNCPKCGKQVVTKRW